MAIFGLMGLAFRVSFFVNDLKVTVSVFVESVSAFIVSLFDGTATMSNNISRVHL